MLRERERREKTFIIQTHAGVSLGLIGGMHVESSDTKVRNARRNSGDAQTARGHTHQATDCAPASNEHVR
jgi:hypothetical protein